MPGFCQADEKAPPRAVWRERGWKCSRCWPKKLFHSDGITMSQWEIIVRIYLPSDVLLKNVDCFNQYLHLLFKFCPLVFGRRKKKHVQVAKKQAIRTKKTKVYKFKRPWIQRKTTAITKWATRTLKTTIVVSMKCLHDTYTCARCLAVHFSHSWAICPSACLHTQTQSHMLELPSNIHAWTVTQ